jgi:hypothetical protein
MPITSIQSYLVHPAKHAEEQPQIAGATIALEGRLFQMLKGVYEKSDTECNIDISFNANDDGTQQNDCRDLVLAYAKSPSSANGRRLAKCLQAVTNKISGLGLLFLMLGEEHGETKFIISRFPADSAILAEQEAGTLTVQFLEKVFMKSATAYKAVMFRGRSFDSDFWLGKAVDKQINSNDLAISHYWIKDFLQSDFRTTSAAGTRRLAIAIREAIKTTTDLSVKEELVSAARLGRSLPRRPTSIQGFGQRFGLSDTAQQAIRRQLPNDRLFAEQFKFDREEFSKHIMYKSVELHNGAVLTAEAARFDDVFSQEVIDRATQDVRFTTQSPIVDQRLKKSKP